MIHRTRSRKQLALGVELVILLWILYSNPSIAFCSPRIIRHRLSPRGWRTPIIPTPSVRISGKRSSSQWLPRRPKRRFRSRSTALAAAGFWENTIPFLDSLQDGISRLFQAASGGGEQLSPLAAIVSIPFWKELTATLQRLGEKFIAAIIFVALLQGGLAVFQYRTNPSGELIVPPGPTVGVEEPEEQSNDGLNDAMMEEENYRPGSTSTSRQTAASLRSGAQTLMRNETTESTASTKTLADPTQQTKTTTPSLKKTTGKQSQNNRHSRMLQRVNKLLVILIPWVAGQAGVLLAQYTHLFHIGSALTLASVFDVPQSYFRKHGHSPEQSLIPRPEQFSLLNRNKEEYHVVVIGDSLAVGLGTVDEFDKDKNNSLPFMRIENLDEKQPKSDQQSSPAFPRALALTLAQTLKKRVTWRSAGVDGGDVSHIREFCLDVIKEEVKKEKEPDVVVILCGANDMKYFLSNPFQKSNWPKGFRARLTDFIREIRGLAPQTTVLLPAIPAQMFHKNSPLNVFPLGLLLDTMVGFWDSQKKLVADAFPSDGVLYLGLSPGEINDWYQSAADREVQHGHTNATDIIHLLEDIDNLDQEKLSSATPNVSLIASDGVHPNARCYANWARAMGNKLLASLPP